MNSSGIKRGLAASAVAALAVTGIPALATSASAATGESATVAYTGPTRNAGDVGGLVVLKTKNITLAEAQAGLRLLAPNLSDGTDTPNQNVDLVGGSIAFAADGATNPFGGADGFDEISFRVTATTPAAGDAVKYAAFFDDGEEDTNDNGAIDGAEDANTDGDLEYNGTVDADEARVQVETTTSGPVSSVTISPDNQTAPAGEAAKYTLSLKDSAGRATQLTGAEDVAVTATGSAVVSDNDIDATDAVDGTAAFTVTGDAGNLGLQTITADVEADDTAISGSDTATLDVVAAATLNIGHIDVVTGADSWSGFGDVDADATDPDNPIAVRVDQGTIRIDIASNEANDKNASVVLTVDGTDATPADATDGTGLTFGGKAKTTVSTTLDSNGRGSVTITPDAGTIQNLDKFKVSGAGLGTLNFEYQRANISSVKAPADVYISGLKGSADISVKVTDQFGLPVAGAQVDAQRTAGANKDAAPQARKVTDANGMATFTFTDANATAGQTSTVTFNVYEDQFDATPNASDTTTIRYTTDGQGADYTLSLDSVNTAGAAYDPSKVSVVPLTDAHANDGGTPTGDEVTTLTIVGGEPGAPVTVSVTNALILDGGTDLSDGVASITGVVGQSFKIVGTKSGVATVTVASAGRTKTADFTVEAQSDSSTARNVTVSGPTDAKAGDLVTFTAVVTDAFGNPVPGVQFSDLNVQVSGDGALQDNGAATDANGAIALNVRLDDDAEGTVNIRVEGVSVTGFDYNQFGAGADKEYPNDAANSAAGLPASSNVGTASVTVKGAEPEPEPAVYPHMKMTGIDKGKRDVIKLDAVDAASGATVTLFKRKGDGSLKRIKSAVLNDAGNFTFRVHDGNGAKATRYTVKLKGNDAVRPSNKSRRIK